MRQCLRGLALANLVLTCVGFSIHAQAVTLPLVADPTTVELDIDPNGPLVPCDQIFDRLDQYNNMAREHDGNVNGFLGTVSKKLTEWHNLLLPLEGTTQVIAKDTFTPLSDGAKKLDSAVLASEQNTNLLSIELNRILDSLYECNVTSKMKVRARP